MINPKKPHLTGSKAACEDKINNLIKTMSDEQKHEKSRLTQNKNANKENQLTSNLETELELCKSELKLAKNRICELQKTIADKESENDKLRSEQSLQPCQTCNIDQKLLDIAKVIFQKKAKRSDLLSLKFDYDGNDDEHHGVNADVDGCDDCGDDGDGNGRR